MTAHTGGRIVVLDDDPTGTQGVSGLPVVLRPDAATIAEVQRSWGGPIWVLTNTRAMAEAEAVGMIETTAAAIRDAMGDDVKLVLRGDSTLRGHVLAEIDALSGPDAVALFVPAFLEAGRVTIDGIHYAEVEGRRIAVAETEYARDHEFGYRSSRLTDWVAEREPSRAAIAVGRDVLRGPRGAADLRDILVSAPAGAIVLPDAETVEDLTTIAAAWESVSTRQVVLRCAASLASVVTCSPPRYIDLRRAAGAVLVVCASYTKGARDQLAALTAEFSPARIQVDIVEAVAGGPRATRHTAVLADALSAALGQHEVVVLSTPRATAAEHLTLTAGQAIMDVVIGAVGGLGIRPGLVITKGGITGARVARDGFAAATATVLGQPAPGVPLWLLDLADGSTLGQLVVPGNVGEPSLIADAVRQVLGQPGPPTPAVALP